MIDKISGEITLCRSGFSIDCFLTPSRLESNLADQIISHHTTDTGYHHYGVWCDIDPFEFVYAEICFLGNSLHSIRLSPQHKADSLCQGITPMELYVAQESVRAWYREKFLQDKWSFPWGTIHFCVGTDPLYAPPHILICYTKRE